MREQKEKKNENEKDNSKNKNVTDMKEVDYPRKKRNRKKTHNKYNSKLMKRLKKKYQDKLTEIQHKFDSQNIMDVANKKKTEQTKENNTNVAKGASNKKL